MEPKIIYEDDYILGLDKPSGLMVHSDGRSEEKTLVDWINTNYPNLAQVGEEQVLQSGVTIKRPGIVHRLDKDTSGVIIVAKTQEVHQFLKKQFQDRRVAKVYNAVVWGSFRSERVEGVISSPIGRSASDFRKWSAQRNARGELREAVTEYKVLANNMEFAYLEVMPKTGRTHQIRVHMKSISHPVVCDKLYGNNKVCDGSSSCLGFSRLALHALSIKVELPDGTFLNLVSELPLEFKTAFDFLKMGAKSDTIVQ